jgi:hypothetical protein
MPLPLDPKGVHFVADFCLSSATDDAAQPLAGEGGGRCGKAETVDIAPLDAPFGWARVGEGGRNGVHEEALVQRLGSSELSSSPGVATSERGTPKTCGLFDKVRNHRTEQQPATAEVAPAATEARLARVSSAEIEAEVAMLEVAESEARSGGCAVEHDTKCLSQCGLSLLPSLLGMMRLLRL